MALSWTLMVVAALLVGFAKTSIGGVATIAVALFAFSLPTRESTAALLLLLLVGDCVAVWHYRHAADLRLLRTLIPAVLPGLVLGSLFLSAVDDAVLRHGIGVMLFVLGLLQLVIHRAEREFATHASSRWASLSTGLAAGFTTMTANAAGAVMTLYLVARGVDKRRFLGTNAVFFLVINVCKVPFSAGLGLFSGATLVRSLVLAPAVLLGTWVGLRTARRLSQAHFDRAVLVATLVSATVLIVA